jgi:Skp family chaperone for outer membrane proteins
MKLRFGIFAVLLTFLLSSCGVTDLAKQAADATACKAAESTINTIVSTYQSGVIDSGLITQIDALIGDQARALLSTGLAEDLKSLTSALQDTNSATSAQTEIQAITDSISKRCADAGVSGIGQ